MRSRLVFCKSLFLLLSLYLTLSLVLPLSLLRSWQIVNLRILLPSSEILQNTLISLLILAQFADPQSSNSIALFWNTTKNNDLLKLNVCNSTTFSRSWAIRSLQNKKRKRKKERRNYVLSYQELSKVPLVPKTPVSLSLSLSLSFGLMPSWAKLAVEMIKSKKNSATCFALITVT